MKPESSIPLPKDPKHQRFADLILEGKPAAEAYKESGFKSSTPKSRSAAAARLLKNVSVASYLAAVRQQAAQGTVASLQYKRELLFQIMDVPLTAINPEDPTRTHHRLIKKLKRRFEVNEAGGGDGSTTCIEEIEKLDPLKAIEIDNKLAGDDPEASHLGAIAAAIASLGGKSPLPQDSM